MRALLRSKPGAYDQNLPLQLISQFPSGGLGGTVYVGLVELREPAIKRVVFFCHGGNLVYPRESGAFECYCDPYIESVSFPVSKEPLHAF